MCLKAIRGWNVLSTIERFTMKKFLYVVFVVFIVPSLMFAQGGSVEGPGVDNCLLDTANGLDPNGFCCLAQEKDCEGICNGNAVEDCAGTCGGDATFDCSGQCGGDAQYDCAMNCNGESEVDECGICDGDGTSCITNRCSTFSVFFDYIFGLGESVPLEDIFIGGEDAPSCLFDLVQSRIEFCINLITDINIGMHKLDDCVADYVSQDLGHEGRYSEDFTLYFDENCNPTNEGTDDSCDAGIISHIFSPISLVWEETFDFEKDVEAKIVNFPLVPGSEEFYTWKASGNAPLLVFDPEKSGKINDGSQLFGNYTFGGKQIASLSSTTTQQTKWRDGFEALETLDVDGSGKIDGLELKPLSLWFDYNQDGKSQSGEVKDVAKLGINWINTKSNRVNASSKSVISDSGYSRTVAGKETVLKAIDWYGEGAKSKAELVTHFLDLASKSPVKTSEKEIAKKDKEFTKKSDFQTHALNGVWKWRVNDGTKGVSGAFLGFKFINSKEFTGHSYYGSNLTRKVGSINSAGGISEIVGEILSENEDQIRLKFKSKNSDNNKVLSYLTYNKKTKELLGSTKTRVNLANSAMSVEYSWSAEKVK